MNWMLLPVGFLAGVCASMGIGGGFVLMLYLTLFAGLAQKDAQLFNLLFFLPVAALALFQHKKSGLIDAKAAKSAVCFCVCGSLRNSVPRACAKFGGILMHGGRRAAKIRFAFARQKVRLH